MTIKEKGPVTVVAIGEILWDVFPDDKRIGGAPANFAYYANKLGERAILMSRVGQDSLGRQAISACHSAGLITDFIQKDLIHPTGRVMVELNEKRIPRFEIEPTSAWDFLEEDESFISLAKAARAVCFGTLAQRNEKSRNTIQNLLDMVGPGCLRVLDLNLRPPFYDLQIIESSLIRADVLKLNSDELKILSGLYSLKGNETELIRALLDKFSLQYVALTRGSEGSLIASKDRESGHPGYLVNVVDTVGAGDAFTAALVCGLLRNEDLDEISKLANQLASFVCTKKGAWVNIADLARPVC